MGHCHESYTGCLTSDPACVDLTTHSTHDSQPMQITVRLVDARKRRLQHSTSPEANVTAATSSVLYIVGTNSDVVLTTHATIGRHWRLA